MTKSNSLRLVLPDIRSAGNVGSIARTANAMGVSHITVCGYTPYPRLPDDSRPGHVSEANTRAIAKTGLGAETTIVWEVANSLPAAIEQLHTNGYTALALEQAEGSTPLPDFVQTEPVAIIVGNEVTGLLDEDLALCDGIIEIPMMGCKESLNVAVATGIALYALRTQQAC